MPHSLLWGYLLINTKRGHSLKVQTENRVSTVALDENKSAHIGKKPTSIMSLGDNNVEKAASERNKTTFTKTPLKSAKSEILREEDQKDKLAVPDQKETIFTCEQQAIKSNIMRELEHNLVIATTPLGDKLIPFDIVCWDNTHLETGQILLDNQEEIVKIYADIDLANTVVVLANRFEHRSEAVTQSYLKLCTKVAEQIKMLIHP